ncbi:hypothetical protein LEP1GSC074_3776 [Leptospira noguchii str. Hook]|nr:hypothetical protein LEP1GSC074_3776 [Leptospira noguchii str. Hook]
MNSTQRDLIHFPEKKLESDFADLFLKCRNYHKSQFYE